MRSVARRVSRTGLFAASLVTALVVAALPGTTIASSDPAFLVPVPALRPTEPPPILIPVSLRSLLASGEPDAFDADAGADVDAAERPFQAAVEPSVLESAMVVSVYGHPGVCVMGELGCHDGPEGAIAAARAIAEEYEALNGGRPVVAALHLIVDVAQAKPGADGQYLDQMPLDEVAVWVEAAREAEVLIFLDLQIGWGDLREHVERLERFLVEPFVHLAVDPEFATESRGGEPGEVIGTLTAEQVNATQRYLSSLVRAERLPAKVLVLHQFRGDMLTDPEAFEDIDRVEITIDMDGWGPPWPKEAHYEAFALAPYAERPAIKLFYEWDEPLMMPSDVMGLSVPPRYVIYQ